MDLLWTDDNNITTEVKQTIVMVNRASYGPKKHLTPRYIARQPNVFYCVLTYGSEGWPLERKDENVLWISERRILRSCGVRRSRYNHELYKLHNEYHNIVKVIKVVRLNWLEHLFGMQEQNPCRNLITHQPDASRRVGSPAVRWLDSVEEDLKTMVSESHRFGTNGEQWYKRPSFFMDCRARRRRRNVSGTVLESSK
jgi:hypothetical protein